MKSFLIDLLIIILVVLGVGSSTAFVDYLRINNNSKPIFSIYNYNKKKDLITYQGLFHRIDIKYYMSSREKLEDSRNIKYTLFNKYDIKLDNNLNNKSNLYLINYKKEDTCNNSKLIYSNKEYNIYSYCLEEDKLIVKSNKDSSKDILLSKFLKNHSFNDIFNNFYYNGLSNDSKAYEYLNKDYNNKLKLYECINNHNYYLIPEDVLYKSDFCSNNN